MPALKQPGFTLLEMLTCLGIIAVLWAMSLAFNIFFFSKNQFDSIENDIKNIVRYARNATIASDQALMLKPLLTSKNWAHGIALIKVSTQELLYQWKWHYPHIQLSWKGFQSSDYLLFAPDLQHSAINGRFIITSKGCSENLILNRFGHIRRVDFFRNATAV